MYKPIMVTPSPEERRALLEMSKQDVRAPYDQIRYLIIAEATKRGLLPEQTQSSAGVRQDMASAAL